MVEDPVGDGSRPPERMGCAAACVLAFVWTCIGCFRALLLVVSVPSGLLALLFSRSHRLERAARVALRLRWNAVARWCAERLLRHATRTGDWTARGDSLHHGQRVLGLVALREGEVEEARRRLLLSADVDGSAVLNSFGPNMLLARELLERGEREAVLAYLERCGRFWPETGKLEGWSEAIRRGELPDFGVNLRY